MDFLNRIKGKLQPHHTAGGFEKDLQDQALFCEYNESPQIVNQLICIAEEADTRVWLHVVKLAGERKLVICADTDVYRISFSVITGTGIN